MGILDEINKVIDKEKIGSSKEYIPAYSTGIDVLDYGNASFNPDTNSVDIGLMAGTLTMFIGPSGSGKTTAALEIAGNIVRGFDNTTIIHADFERATSSNRAKTILDLSDEEFKEKYTKLNSGISSESVYKLCKAVAQVKKDKYEEIKYDTGHKDDKGDTIYELPPTIIIVDSIAAMFPENTNDEDELGGQMSATAAAKVNNQIIKRLIGSSTLEQGNIMIFAINHITTKVDINPMAKTPAALNFLKPDESLPQLVCC